jgi:hypothetical protein
MTTRSNWKIPALLVAAAALVSGGLVVAKRAEAAHRATAAARVHVEAPALQQVSSQEASASNDIQDFPQLD